MLRSILQNSTAGFYVFASDSTTPTSGKTGLTMTVTLSKAGGTANSVSPTITEIGNGLYWIAPIAAHRDTLGEIAWQFSASGAIIAPRLEKVVAVNDQVAAFGANTTAPDNSTIGSIYSVIQLTDADVATLLTRIVGTLASGTHNPQSGDAFARLGVPAGASVSADIASVKTDTGNLVTRITSTLFSGITSLKNWLGALAGKTADTSTRAEINATTAGASYNETTDSLQALRDRGDVAWITGSSGAGTGARTITVTVTDNLATPLQNATVRFTEGANTFVASTNSSGVKEFNLDDATYTVAITKDGFEYFGGTLVVSADAPVTYVMTRNTPIPVVQGHIARRAIPVTVMDRTT